MNMKGLLLALTSVLMLSGCALIKKNNVQEISTITPVATADFEAYGAEHMDVLGMVATTVDSRCSAVEFFKYVTKLFPEADDMIDIRMEETETQKGAVTTYSCKYTGLAVSYTPLSLADAQKWMKAKKKSPEVIVVQAPPPPPATCTPCTCVTCGCQPCNNINQNNYYNPNNQ